MCRSIRTLRDTGPTTGDLEAAARQFVRKISGYRQPAARNAAAFDAAIAAVAAAAHELLRGVGTDVAEGPETPPAEWPRRSA